MNFDTFYTSSISATAIMIGVGFPFILYLVTTYDKNRDQLFSEMKVFYPNIKAFTELVFEYFQLDIWNNRAILSKYIRALRKGDKKEINELKTEHDFLSLYDSFSFLSEEFRCEIMRGSKLIYTNNEIEEYHIHINRIWHSINCRSDIIKEINCHCFSSLPELRSNKIRALIKKIDQNILADSISMQLLANIAGVLEINVVEKLNYLTIKYERPINNIVNRLYGIMSISLVFGVIFPLLLILFSATNIFYLAVITISIFIACSLALVIITGLYIGII